MIPTFEEQREAWSSPPVDDVGYLSSKSLLKLSDEEIVEMMEAMALTRYEGWRSHQGAWRRVFELDTTYDSFVLDYGCGVGLEALQYAKLGNRVVLADISEANLAFASRMLRVYGYEPYASILLGSEPPANLASLPIDVIHCVGVLHHIPNAGQVVRAFHRWLSDDGQVRLMLYSDRAWKGATGSRAPAGDTAADPHFLTFVQAMDGVGGYADWYSIEKIEWLWGDIFYTQQWDYLTHNGYYLGVVLEKV